MYGDIIDIITSACTADNAAEYIAYLANTTKNNDPYREWLINNGRCPCCGSDELRTQYVKEIHTELEEHPIEIIPWGWVCAECGEVIE